MPLFFAIVHHNPGSAYGVSFPDLPGCHSGADESQDLIANAQDALDLWFEGQPWVEPRDIEALRAEVADDLREGAFIMAVPYSPAGDQRAA